MLVALLALQALPVELDLRAAYCARVTRHQHELVRTLLAAIPEDASDRPALERTVVEVEALQARWYGYINPRISHMDVAPLQSAVDAADSDFRIATAATSGETSAASEGATDRLRRCNDLSVLPY